MFVLPLTLVHAAPANSLQVNLNDLVSGNPVSDLKVSIWLAADSRLRPAGGFEDADVDWAEVNFDLEHSNRELAEYLFEYVAQNDIAPFESIDTGNDGVALFTELEGVYLVVTVDNRNPVQYEFAHFVVSVPLTGSSDVTAAPKGGVIDRGGGGDGGGGTPPDTSTSTDDYSPPDRPNLVPDGDGYIELDEDGTPLGRWEPADDGEDEFWIFEEMVPLGELPQTGVLRWPVPVLSLSGLLFIALGAIMNRRGRQAHAE